SGGAVGDVRPGHGNRAALVGQTVGGFVLDGGLGRFSSFGSYWLTGFVTSPLDHEARDHAVEDRAVIKLVVHIGQEVLHRDGRLVRVELDPDLPHRGIDDHNGILV